MTVLSSLTQSIIIMITTYRSAFQLFRFCSTHNHQQHSKQLQKMKIQKYGMYLGKILIHVQSQSFRNHFQLKRYIHSHAWCCLHVWMLAHRSRSMHRRPNEYLLALIFRGALRIDLEKFNYRQVENYSDRKDRQVYYQLRRIYNVTHFALDDYFRYNFTEKPLSQIICEDMGLYPEQDLTVEEVENVGHIEQYIHNNMQQLEDIVLLDVVRGKFEWRI